ncbi:MAG TPA: Flp pilus assembly protein CpaB [Aeromicrobium sp.]|nr:Flp pilus assembly protein CpaB [Aeromicrobium sp.]
MKKQVVALIVAGALALLAVGALVVYAKGAQDRALEGTETIDVLVAKEDIAVKTPVAELADKVAVTKVPKSVALDGAISSLDKFDGQVTSVALVTGDQLSAGKLATPDDVKGAVAVPDGLQELAISIAGERFVGGLPKTGDKVGVFSSFTLSDGTKLTGNPINQLLVLKVDNGIAGSEDAAGTIVTLAVTNKQAKQIIHTREFGAIWMTLQNDKTNTDDDATITYEDVTP